MVGRITRITSSARQEPGEHCYLLRDTSGTGVLIDPGADGDAIVAAVERSDVALAAVVSTHGHYDHVASASRVIERFGVLFGLHAADEPLLRHLKLYLFAFGDARDVEPPKVGFHLQEGVPLAFGQTEMLVLATPGHTPGGVSFVVPLTGDAAEEWRAPWLVLSGDTLFASSVGRTDLPGGDEHALCASLRRLQTLPDNAALAPGHGQRSWLLEALRSPRVLALFKRTHEVDV